MTLVPHAPLGSVRFIFEKTENYPAVVVIFKYVNLYTVEIYAAEIKKIVSLSTEFETTPVLLDDDYSLTSVSVFTARFFYNKYIVDFKN